MWECSDQLKPPSLPSTNHATKEKKNRQSFSHFGPGIGMLFAQLLKLRCQARVQQGLPDLALNVPLLLACREETCKPQAKAGSIGSPTCSLRYT